MTSNTCSVVLDYTGVADNHSFYFPPYSGLWSMIAVGLFLSTDNAKCNLHVTFEGLCYCNLRLPELVMNECKCTDICIKRNDLACHSIPCTIHSTF